MASPLAALPLVNKAGAKGDISGKVVALYFSAHWCPPCRGFTPALRQFYESLKKSGEPIEIIFVSGDKSEEEFRDYFLKEHGDWLAVDFGAEKERAALSKQYGVSGIPSLIVVDSKGQPVSDSGREDVAGATSPEAAVKAFEAWKKAAGDWRESPGTTLGGASGAPAAGDAAALRAARLAALEKRGL
ncbi:unnamed protein product [Polarella glacialis]|uniref:Thioredoxin domain-containing protein n=1 Tax=Polarella glacialis TaxID=89957 RepID=A0A813GP52_POLGL|nr:unnamed protein product [Polarella glacialis]